MGTYNNGQPYRVARGRAAPREQVVDATATVHSVVTGTPSSDEFIRLIVRELKIRAYQRTTIKSYTDVLRRFLRWFGWPPHRVDGESVRCYLELLADCGKGPSTLASTVSAIRTAFDKFCGRNVTLGLATPRKRHRLPVVPNREEIKRLLAAASTDQDKVMLGLMYATGLRVSEVARLQWTDLDFVRNSVFVRSGKGKSDRLVVLPKALRAELHRRSRNHAGSEFLFPAGTGQDNRHLTPRTIERVVKDCRERAGIVKRVTPHSLRHAFATHLMEGGVDIRFIQKLLGHVRLETTSIYTHVAQAKVSKICTPLDQLVDANSESL